MAGRASIVGAAETNVGKVRDHNEDSHFIDPETGIFVVCDGMGGHAAGEVASAIAVQTVREAWASDATQKVAEQWLQRGTPEAHKRLLSAITQGVVDAHDAIIAETKADRGKTGMGTTIVGCMVVGGEMVFAHCGDSRAYLVRDGIAMQLTEDHTLLARLLAAGVDVDTEGEGSRFKSMLTNALGIGQECKASTFVVPLADGDRFLLCSDGITEYVKEHEIGEVLGKAPSPARAAQKLVDMALDRGGGDNATALVVRVLEAGEISRPSEELRKEQAAIFACPLFAKCNPQQRLRALRIALPRDHAAGERIPAMTLGDRVAWIIIEGQLDQDGAVLGPGALVYPEALLPDRPLPDKDGLAVPRTEVRALALRSDDFRELCDEDPDLAEQLMAALGEEITNRAKRRLEPTPEVDWRRTTDPDMENGPTLTPGTVMSPFAETRTATRNMRPRTDPGIPKIDNELSRRTTDPNVPVRAATEPPALPETPPPGESRARTNTDVGGPPSPRAPAVPVLPSLPNPFRQQARGSTPPAAPQPLKSGKAETEAALDHAMDKITGDVDEMWAETPEESQPETKPEFITGRKRTESGEQSQPTEIVVEADEPPEDVVRAAKAPVSAPPPPSEPEIQITRLAEEADKSESDGEVIEMTVDDSEPQKKPSDHSEPEILIVRPGRAITADDTPLVAGAIDTKRPKRGTDA
ncbi:MAG: protein phosphatase 2C domain-containing protein [Deltaproteobacteria bacterium]|nr:protein phosphatase 2C domain-containing protein [Deltaproteobacteria bacterium]